MCDLPQADLSADFMALLSSRSLRLVRGLRAFSLRFSLCVIITCLSATAGFLLSGNSIANAQLQNGYRAIQAIS